MPSVGEQRDGMRGDAIENLDNNQPDIKGGRNREHRTKVFRRVGMAMAGVIMIVRHGFRFFQQK